MSARRQLGLAALPGLALAVVALTGGVPQIRDIASYFVPLRGRTAEVMLGRRGPFWNPDVGCGEPYFANPQTGILYPPAWLAVVLPPDRAVGVEAGLHLAWLAAGCALLARRLGASGGYVLAAGWGAACSGPAIDAMGVLNNLSALSWLPWLWQAALASSGAGVAACLGGSYLAGEPQLAAVGAAVALLLAPRRRTAAAMVLAGGLVAAQLIPFVVWAREGNRGASTEAAEASAGAIRPAELPALLTPQRELQPRHDRFVAYLTLPLWGIALGFLAILSGAGAGRRLALAAVFLLLLSVVAGWAWGADLWLGATAGLVRYPGRLAFVAMAALLPAAAASGRKVLSWRPGLAAGAVLAAVGLGLGGAPLAATVQGLSAGMALVGGGVGAVAATLGSAALSGSHVPALRVRWGASSEARACLDAQLDTGRVYAVEPSWKQFSWVREGYSERLADLGWGYSCLLDGRQMVRTFAPLSSRALAVHLAEVDRGPAGRWWLNALGATRVLSHHPMPHFAPHCRAGELMVFDNPGAWPTVAVAREMPRPETRPHFAGAVAHVESGDDARNWRVWVPQRGGTLLWLSTPDPGWQFFVDGAAVEARRGPGIIQGIDLTAGEHQVVARYRPPGLVVGSLLSLLCLGALVGGAWRRW